MQRRFAGLELLRFVAALVVLFWHYKHFFYAVPEWDPARFDLEALPGASLFGLAYRQGHFAVQLFWAISGFIFFHRYAEAIRERRVTLREYLVNRVSRLYPLHLVTLCLVGLLQDAFQRSGHAISFVYPFNDLRHFGLQLLMLSHWGLQRGFSFNGPVWTISVEEFCYLVFFFLASGMAFHRRTFPVLLAAAWGLLALRVIHPDFAECLALFFVGGAVWGLYAWATADAGRRWVPWAGLVGGAALVALGVPVYEGLSPLMQKTATHFVLVPTLLLGFLTLSPRDGSFGARVAGELGKLTYATYMVHFPLQLAAVMVVEALGVSRAVFYSPLALLLFIASVMAVGQVVFTRFERPMQAWMRRRLLLKREGIEATAEAENVPLAGG